MPLTGRAAGARPRMPVLETQGLAPPAVPDEVERATLDLVRRLGEALETLGVRHCQWKGHWRRSRWATGAGDIDLLVDPRSADAFDRVLQRLGFRRADPPPAAQVPGIVSHLGVDPRTHRLVHVHAHYRLIVGDAGRARWHLPVEAALLDGARPGELFRAPPAALELVLFVIRMAARHSLRDVVRPGGARWLERVPGELAHHRAGVGDAELRETLGRHFPMLDPALFARCVASLDPAMPRWRAVLAGRALHRALAAYVVGPSVTRRMSYRAARRIGRALSPPGGRGPAVRADGKRFASGGTVFALVGGDGSGKSTCARELTRWLSAELATMHAHLGRPPRSALTLFVGGVRRATRVVRRARDRAAALDGLERPASGDARPFPGYLEMARLACTARDRYRLYERIRRFGAGGGIVFCERYPIPQNRALVGPRLGPWIDDARRPLARALARLEARWHARILPPDVVIVLRVSPEVAVARKLTEPAEYVRARNRAIWGVDWSGTGAHVVDAEQPLPEVLAELRSIVWHRL